MTETVITQPLTVYAVYKGDEDSGPTAKKKSGSKGAAATGSATAGLRFHSSSSALGASTSASLPSGRTSGGATDKDRPVARTQTSNTVAAPLASSSSPSDDTPSEEQEQQSQAPVIPILVLMAAILLIAWRIYALYARRVVEGEAFIEPVPADGREIRF